MKRGFLGAVATRALSSAAGAQQSPLPYGSPVTLAQAKTIVAAAEQSARSRNFTMAFAIVEPSGELVLFHKMDGTQYGSDLVAREKARTAARFKRSTKAFFDSIAGGRNAVLSLPGVERRSRGVKPRVHWVPTIARRAPTTRIGFPRRHRCDF